MLNQRLASIFAATTSFTLLMLSGMFGVGRANAVSVNYSSAGVANGIDDLNVNGQKYDVDFVYDTFVNVFGNPMVPGWTPPNFSAFVEPNVPNPSIQDATDAVVAELNSVSSNQVADVNSGTPKNYFITGGLVDRGPDTVQIFYGEQNSASQWLSSSVTCNYSSLASIMASCGQTFLSFGITVPSSVNQSNYTSYLFTQPQVMFAKYTPESVPEPITILGTIVAGGMGFAIKRKQKNKTA